MACKRREKRRQHRYKKYEFLVKQELKNIIKFGKEEPASDVYKFLNKACFQAPMKSIEFPFIINKSLNGSNMCLLIDSFQSNLQEGLSCQVCKTLTGRCAVEDNSFHAIESIRTNAKVAVSLFKKFPVLIRACIDAASLTVLDKDNELELKQSAVDVAILLSRHRAELMYCAMALFSCIASTESRAPGFSFRQDALTKVSEFSIVQFELNNLLVSSVEITLNSQFMHLCQNTCRNICYDGQLNVSVSKTSDQNTLLLNITRQYAVENVTTLDRNKEHDMRKALLSLVQEEIF